MGLTFFDKARELTEELEKTQAESIHQAAKLVADSIMNDGIIQAFGSGHSYAAAIEVCGRAGGLIPSKVIMDQLAVIMNRLRVLVPCLLIDYKRNRMIYSSLYLIQDAIQWELSLRNGLNHRAVN